jgi:hypothetical protein
MSQIDNAPPAAASVAHHTIAFLAANVDNLSITDKEFRNLVRSCLSVPVLRVAAGEFPPERQVVMTNRGKAYMHHGLWFVWHGVVGSQTAIRDQSSIKTWQLDPALPVAP